MAFELQNKEESSNKFSYNVGSVPTVFYIPDYVTAIEEENLLNNIYQAPVSKWKSLKNRRLQNWGGVVHEKGLIPQNLPPWLKQITHRIHEESGLFSSEINHVLINEYRPNQGIMPHQDGPAYEPVVAILSLGSPVVMDFQPHPSFVNASTSENHNKDIIDKPVDMDTSSGERLKEYLPFSVALMPRSLLVFKDNAYSDYLHGIKDCENQQCDQAVNVTNVVENDEQVKSLSGLRMSVDDTESDQDTIIHRTKTRVSLTCRVVKKVHKNLIKL